MPSQSDTDPTAQPKPKRNRSPYPEKGLVAGLQSAGEKLSTAGGWALAEEELTDEHLELFRTLVAQAQALLEKIGETRRGEPDVPLIRNARRFPKRRW
jgi:hypothetical protein